MIVTLVGLENAGKTSIKVFIQTLSLEKALNTKTSTKIEELRKKKVKFYIIPGQRVFRFDEKYYKTLFPISDVVVFVVDAADKSRFEKAQEYFEFVKEMMKKYGKEGQKLLILAHKQDLENAVPGKEIAKLLGVSEKYVLETSIFDPTSILHLILRLHGEKVTVFEAIAMKLLQDTKADTVAIADKNGFPYAVFGNEEIAMSYIAATSKTFMEIGSFSMNIIIKEKNKTICMMDSVEDDFIFLIVINARENIRKVSECMKSALVKIKEAYVKRWK